jgi:NhaP-type Na+/H+ and K+/H+ antiporters
LIYTIHILSSISTNYAHHNKAASTSKTVDKKEFEVKQQGKLLEFQFCPSFCDDHWYLCLNNRQELFASMQPISIPRSTTKWSSPPSSQACNDSSPPLSKIVSKRRAKVFCTVAVLCCSLSNLPVSHAGFETTIHEDIAKNPTNQRHRNTSSNAPRYASSRSRYGLMEDYLPYKEKNEKDSNRLITNEKIVDQGVSRPTYYALPLEREEEAAQAYYDDADGGGGAVADDYVHDADNNFFNADDLCSEYLLSFLEGITDAKDNCDGIQNAYIAAYCHEQEEDYNADDDHDDYFVKYNHFSCCQAIKSHYDTYCNRVLYLTNTHLLLVAIVLLLCEMAKSVIKFRGLHWLPEAGGCILVGTLIGAITHWMPSVNLEALSFDEDLFLGVLLPPIIFEAALSVNKKEFRRRRMAIFMFAVVGTILSTFMTGYMVHYASSFIQSVTTLPLLDSLIFGCAYILD